MTARRTTALAAALVAVLLAGACSEDDADTAVLGATTVAVPQTAADTTTTAAPATSGTPSSTTEPVVPPTELAPPVVIAEALPVGRTSRVVVDESRETVAIAGVTEAAPSRTIPTLVLYPAAGGAPGEVVEAAPAAGTGPFPLVVVSHGLTGTAEGLLPLLTGIAAAGYVVVSPDFPETTGGTDFSALTRFVEQPRDVSVVIDAVLADPELAPLVDAERIGAGGHSLGGLTTYGLVYNDCCRDTRIDAAFTLAGALLPYPDGSYDWDGPPLLLVQGEDDPLVQAATSEGVFAGLTGTGYLMTLLDTGHSAGLDPADVAHEAVVATIVAFLDRWVREDPRAETALATAGAVDGVTTFTVR